MQNTTKEIITKGGVKIVYNTSITYGQHNEIKAIYLGKKENETDGDMILRADRRGIEIVVVSIDGDKENIYDRFSNLDYVDVKPVMEIVKDILDPKV